MIYDLKHLADFLIKYKMNGNQFLLCWILQWADREPDELGFNGVIPPSDQQESSMVSYYKLISSHQWIRKSEIDDLKERGYIRIPKRANDPYNLSIADTTEKFSKGLVSTKNDFEELWNTYPSTIPNFNHPSGPEVKLKSCVYDEVENLYFKYVRTKKLHNRIIDALLWGDENDQINQNIKNFVGGKNWEMLFEQMDESSESTTNRTIL